MQWSVTFMQFHFIFIDKRHITRFPNNYWKTSKCFQNVHHSTDFQQVFLYLNNFYLPEFEPGEKRFCLFMSYSNKSLSIYVHKSVTSFEPPILKQESIAFCFCLVFNVKSGLPHVYNWSCVSYCFYPLAGISRYLEISRN